MLRTGKRHHMSLFDILKRTFSNLNLILSCPFIFNIEINTQHEYEFPESVSVWGFLI